MIAIIGVIPVLVVTGARAYRKLVQRRLPLDAAFQELSLAAAAVIAVGSAEVATHLVRAAGGFVLNRPAQGFVLAYRMPGNMWGAVGNFLAVFSADFFGQRIGPGERVRGPAAGRGQQHEVHVQLTLCQARPDEVADDVLT